MEIAVFALIPILAVLAAVTWLLWQVLRVIGFGIRGVGSGVAFVLRRTGRFVSTEFVEAVHVAGGLLTAAVLFPLAGINLAIGRWKTGRHYGRALEDELRSSALGVYRIALAHPLRFVGLGALLDGLERRVPEVMDRAPRRPAAAAPDEFPGYTVVGTLPAGGSGAQLYLARPLPETLARAAAEGREMPEDVVVKSFDLVQGSTLPQIVRESRALEAAGRLGLVVEHHLSDERFYYVMRYVRGEELDTVVQRMHAESGPEGLRDGDLARTLSYAQDMLENLDRFHQGGLWHKDIKPANLIVSEGRVHLVDLGLVTPLQSALTLTTHGTEYYRDPEMVRLAMQGVKVHEVDGVKFDLYSAGAVLYSMVENSFPAHGSLSSITKRCPEGLTWIIRRAMADIESRYGSAWEMLEDLDAVAKARDPFALRPADLPSVRRQEAGEPVPASRPATFARRTIDPEPASSARPFVASDPVAAASAAAARAATAAANVAAGASRCATGWLSSSRWCSGRPRRRPHVLGPIAAGFVVMVFVFGTLLGHSGSDEPRVAHSFATEPSLDLYEFERETYRQGTAILESLSVDDEVSRWERELDRSFEEELALERVPAPVVSAAPAAEARALRPGHVLLLEDTSLNGRPAEQRILDSVRRELRERGCELATSFEQEAGARHAVGLGTIEDREAQGRLQEFLDRSAELDMIVWIAGGEDEALRYRVLVRNDALRTASRP